MMKTHMPMMFLCITLFFGGCLASSPGEPREDPQLNDPVGDLGSEVQIELEGCSTFYLVTATASDWVRPHVPEGFEPRHLVPGQNFIRVTSYECERAVFNNSVEEDFRLFKLSVDSIARFPGGDNRTTWFYADIHTNSEAYQKILTDLGGNANLADILETQDDGPDLSRFRRTIEGTGYRIELDFPQGLSDDRQGKTSTATWYPGPPHVRVRIEGTEIQRHAHTWTVASLSMTGDSVTRSIFGGSDAWGFTNSISLQGNYTFSLDGGYEP